MLDLPRSAQHARQSTEPSSRPMEKPRPSFRVRRLRLGLTLVEVLLAIALSSIILGLLASVVRIQMRAFDINRTNMVEDQLARTILRQMAGEIRGVVNPANVVASETSAVAGSVPTEEDAAAAGGTGSSAEEEEATGEYTDQSMPTEPGLYGTQYEIQFDTAQAVTLSSNTMSLGNSMSVSNGAAAATTGSTSSADSDAAFVRGELRRVGYYVGSTTGSSASTSTAGLAGDQPGLLRSVSDHPSAQWAAVNGGENFALIQLLAPEVVALEFQYFDGSQWLTEWDSTVQGGLPVAVDIMITLQHIDTRNSQGLTNGVAVTSSSPTSASGIASLDIYRLTVFIPAGKATDEQEAEY
ncbi:MAG: hypothetical protein KDA60_09635 [Planctomycetales bacterium]|nr:hypothetical protein [Planctomycetales bacterium]